MYNPWPKIEKRFRFFSKKLKKIRRPSLGTILIILGALFVLSVPISKLIVQRNSLVAPKEDLVSEPIRADGKLFTLKTRDELLPQRVVIPSAGIDIAVKPAKVIKGKWEVFDDVASFGLGSAEPGVSGNAVIFAHARKGLFLPLREVKLSDKIYVLTKDKWFSYEVSEIKEVLPNQIEVISPTSDERLTLYTCSGFADSRRLLVVAKRTHL